MWNTMAHKFETYTVRRIFTHIPRGCGLEETHAYQLTLYPPRLTADPLLNCGGRNTYAFLQIQNLHEGDLSMEQDRLVKDQVEDET